MAIAEKYKQTGGGMKEGEHRVKITDIKTGLSKKGDKMLTVTFENEEGQTIKGYYVKTQKFMMSQLDDLKEAAGLKPSHAADELLGLKVGILVKENPAEGDKVFMRIAGYGKAEDVDDSHTRAENGKAPAIGKKANEPEHDLNQEIPF